ncbi:putative enzyme related to lactoylglutathione lyase [Sphingomonas sp. SORGH_AS870]|uniref:VOC family protein n=1 Tax=Sphingomonas sp. SORGH_AS_0870 TaxID=3041801 RepID=UPI002858FAB7|nr:VOC family protein [Sphingomonas sp. SORGH_AS_0870]MDR6146947.1 putative enzyme related to lactoylglutathione lyase [Sphingomonas sp. SORGH_AS_0870]
MARLDYLELPVGDRAAAKRFYAEAFGWRFTDFGPDYAATMSGDTDVGLDASPEKVKAPLPVIRVEALEATLSAIEAAGGTIVVPIFAFPGGRRFHFRDVDGHELAVMQAD